MYNCNLTLIQEDSKKEILRRFLVLKDLLAVLGRHRPSIEVRPGPDLEVAVLATLTSRCPKGPLPPLQLVGSDEVGSPSSVCHFGLPSRGASLGIEPRVDPRHPRVPVCSWYVHPRQLRQSVVLVVSPRTAIVVGPGSVHVRMALRATVDCGEVRPN
jgi:hypothetical protein